MMDKIYGFRLFNYLPDQTIVYRLNRAYFAKLSKYEMGQIIVCLLLSHQSTDIRKLLRSYIHYFELKRDNCRLVQSRRKP